MGSCSIDIIEFSVLQGEKSFRDLLHNNVNIVSTTELYT